MQLRDYLPKTLFGRMLSIILIPMILVQIVTVFIFYERHWDSVTRQMQPYAASGGALGADGLLYLSGHDKPEVYVLAAPRMGPKLIHVATISVNIEGQAIAWDDSAERVLIGISRSSREIKSFRIPPVVLPAGLFRLTEVNFTL